MNLENVIHITTTYFLPFFGLPLLGVVIGAWLTNSFFPFRLKRREWRWGKELWAIELFFETLSRISFIADDYLNEEYSEKFSMSGLGLYEADKEIKCLIKELHLQGFKLRLYLDKNTKTLFDDYLVNSQDEYDAAKATWKDYQGDDHAEAMHTEKTMKAQKEVADKVLKKFEILH